MRDPLKISVVVPTCDRPDRLAACLARLAPGEQSLPAERYETIVSNDGLRGLDAREFPWARFTQGPRRGPAANRNHGARQARAEWLAFTDDDCLPSRDWLAAFARVADSGEFDLFEGKVEAPDWTGHPLDERVENRNGGVFWSCNLAVRRALFEQSGGFDEDFPQAAFEDMEFAARLKRLGARGQFVPEARIEHPVRRITLRQLWRRRLMLRWYALYLRKTNPPRSLAWVLFGNLLRSVRRELREFEPRHWPRGIFAPAWETATFPIVLPYVLWCDRRARKLWKSAKA